MATKIWVHGSGHKAASWNETISYMTDNEDIVCPNLSSILEGKTASYENLYSSFVKYCKDTFALGNTMKNLDFSDKLQKIKCPTLILCGKKDSANMKSAYYLSQNIKNSELKVIENTGHVVNEESPEILAKILTEYYSLNA